MVSLMVFFYTSLCLEIFILKTFCRVLTWVLHVEKEERTELVFLLK